MYELKPEFASVKSFYGKAMVKNTENNDGEFIKILYSYKTPVIAINYHTGIISRLWNGWSATTGRHINEFIKQETGHGLSKAEWQKMEVISE
jgi:hypothetical protein